MKEEIYEYLWSLGILEAEKNTCIVGIKTPTREVTVNDPLTSNGWTRRDAIIDSVRGGGRLQGLFSDEEWTLLRGMITRMDREVKLSNLLEKK